MFNTLLVQPIFNLLAVLYAFTHDFGLAIILLTIVIRLIIWPLVTRQLHSQRALQELQPELKRIRDEAAGDKALEGKLTMELYKEREISPFASFLPLLIQLPILFALFVVLRDAVKPGEFAKLAYPAVQQMAAVSAIIHGHIKFEPTLLGLINLTKPSWILALIAAGLQFVQTRQLTPKKQSNDTQAQVMASMNYMFPAITFFIGLSWPAALSLYWSTASAVAVFQQTLVLRRYVAELEEATIVSSTPSNALPEKSASRKGKGKKRHAKAKGGSS